MREKLRQWKWQLKYWYQRKRDYFTGEDVKQDLAYALNERGIKPDSVRIHSVKVARFLGKIHIWIRLERLGIFIGRKGADYEALREIIGKGQGASVVFHLKEFRPLPIVYTMAEVNAICLGEA